MGTTESCNSPLNTPKVDADTTPATHNNRPATVLIEDVLELFNVGFAPLLAQIAPLATRIDELRNAGLLPSTLAGEKSFIELADVANRSVRMAERFAELEELLKSAALHDDERLLVEDLVRSSASELAGKAKRQNIGIHLEEPKGVLAPVYGSRRWVGLAMRSLLEQLADNTPAGNHINLQIRQVGAHQLISGRIQAGKPTANSQNLIAGAAATRSHSTTSNSTTRLDFILAHTIIKLHGGIFKTEQSENERLLQFTFTMPTGKPSDTRPRCKCDNCPFQQQALQYASDLAALLAERNPSETPQEVTRS